MRIKVIICLLVIVIITIALILAKDCLNYCSSVENLLIGLLASSLVVLLIEAITYLMNINRYSYLSGKFERIKIFNKLDQRDGDIIYEDITKRYDETKVNKDIHIKDNGEGRFSGEANYEEGKQAFELFLDQTNPSYGKGIYHYAEKHKAYMNSMPDFGKLEIIRDKNNSRTIYIIYQNISPSGIAAGYEIWRKKTTHNSFNKAILYFIKS